MNNVSIEDYIIHVYIHIHLPHNYRGAKLVSIVEGGKSPNTHLFVDTVYMYFTCSCMIRIVHVHALLIYSDCECTLLQF